MRRIALAVFAVMLAAALAACGQAQPQPSESAQEGTAFGNPWVSGIFTGNLPESAPEATDDLYLHYAYDYIAAHQDGTASSVIGDSAGELRQAVTAAIEDEASTSPELEQLRIFYGQAADTEALAAAGADELKPYLKAIADTQSLDELEQLLVSKDFPFSPWIETTISAPDMKSDMCVAIMPHMLFSDQETGTDMYQDTDDPDIQAAHYQIRFAKTAEAEAGIVLLSIRDDATQAQELSEKLFELEKAYGKDDYQAKYLDAAYGAQTQAIKVLSMEQLEAACPNFPLRETLAKLGEDGSENVVVMQPEWLESFNGIWTEDNFELLRAMTELKVLGECADFINPVFYADARTRLAAPEPTAADIAWTACDRTDTFAQLLAKTYVERVFSEQAVDELEALSNDLIDTYIQLIGTTPWLNKQSRENVMDKIDNMALNILHPDGGYFDYSGLQLTPTEEGGTLFGNYLKLKAYNDQLEAGLIGQPARAASAWLYLRPTMQNCFYEPMSNSINIFPGFVTSTMYREGMGQEELLAGMGFIIGHEISHAFDYSSSQFDAFGRPEPIYLEDDVREFVALRQKLADRYSAVEVAPEKRIDGIATSAEAAADLSGMQAICERARDIDGFSYQKMFACFAETRAQVCPELYMDALLLDSHAPYNVRVNVSAQMMDAYYETFNAAEGDAMYLAPDERVLMWGENAG